MSITGQVERLVRSSGLVNGLAHIFVQGSGLVLFSLDCPGGNLGAAEKLIQGLQGLDQSSALLSVLCPPSQCFPFVRGQLQRATWQELILVDFAPEERWHQVIVQLIGE
jgi:thiamine phosphate synthase YjbQ (UPF0047 family)